MKSFFRLNTTKMLTRIAVATAVLSSKKHTIPMPAINIKRYIATKGGWVQERRGKGERGGRERKGERNVHNITMMRVDISCMPEPSTEVVISVLQIEHKYPGSLEGSYTWW